MVEKLSLKTKIVLATIITILTFVGLCSAIILLIKYIDKLDNTLLKIEKIQKNIALLRNNEKNFFERKDLNYRLIFETNINYIYMDIDELKSELKEYNLETKNIQEYENNIRTYDELFLQIVKLQSKIGFDENNGLYGAFRNSIHKIEDYALKNNNKILLSQIYDLRKEEKDFMLRKDMKYIDRFNEKINLLLNEDKLDSVNKNYLLEYKDYFSQFVILENKIGLTYTQGLYEKLREHINKTEQHQLVISDRLSTLIKNKIALIQRITITFCIFMVILITIFSISIMKTVFGPLSKLLEDYKSAVDESTIVSKANANGIITYVNDQFCEISGYKREELIGKAHNIVRHPDTPKEVFEDLWNTIKVNKQTWKGIIKNLKKDGTPYWVKSVIKPIIDTNGEIIEFIAIRTDITEIEENKEHLKKQYSINSEEYEDIVRLSNYYESIIDKSSIIIRISKDFKINYVNNNFCELTGFAKDELINESYSKLIYSNVNIVNIQSMFDESLKNGIWKGQLSGYTKNGKEIHFTTSIFPIKNKNNEVIEYMAIRNDITEITELHTELEDTQREIIYKMGEIAESRSNETGQHVKRVAEYSKLLALKAGLTNEKAEILKLASPMHDLGKVAIPDSILNKPGKLTSEEFEIMKNHTLIGYEVLNNSNREILKSAAIISYEHHEKWDGTGYPRGLKGEDIHIYGRITAICDVFDALAHERVYKSAWKMEDILNLFKEQRGKHFDPNLINLFFENLDEFIKIKNELD